LPAAVEALLAGASSVVQPVAATGQVVAPTNPEAVPSDFSGVLVATSGSTGHPKTVLLSRRALLAAARASQARLGAPGRWVNPLPLWYVAGLMTLVRALVAGRAHTQVSARLEDLPGCAETAYLSLVPAQLHRGLSDPVLAERLATYHTVLVGGGALDPALRRRGERAGVRLVATYGMSETCGGVVWDGVALDQVSLAIRPAPAPDAGRILVTTPSAFDGYLGDPGATAGALDGQTVITADFGRLANGRLEVLGRLDEVVKSGGHNVDLARIQRLLDQEFPGQAACFAVPDPVWGSIVAVASTGPGLAEIGHRLAALVDQAALPRRFLGLASLPRTASGKIDRAALTKRWADGQRG
jgi:O-succinylbenzoic acid--CoA ligase